MEFDEYLVRQTQVAVGDDTIAVVYLVQVADTVPADIRAWRERIWQPTRRPMEWLPNCRHVGAYGPPARPAVG